MTGTGNFTMYEWTEEKVDGFGSIIDSDWAEKLSDLQNQKSRGSWWVVDEGRPTNPDRKRIEDTEEAQEAFRLKAINDPWAALVDLGLQTSTDEVCFGFFEIALVQYVYRSGLQDSRQYLYITEDGNLPEHFEDGHKVPQKYMREFESTKLKAPVGKCNNRFSKITTILGNLSYLEDHLSESDVLFPQYPIFDTKDLVQNLIKLGILLQDTNCKMPEPEAEFIEAMHHAGNLDSKYYTHELPMLLEKCTLTVLDRY